MLRSANWSQQAETPPICYYLSGVIVVRDALPLLLFVAALVVAVSCAFVYAVGVPITHCARQQREGEREGKREERCWQNWSKPSQASRQTGREAALLLLPQECHISL